MALTFSGSYGAGASSVDSINVTGVSAAVGDLVLVVFVCGDNQDRETDTISSVTDTEGNTYNVQYVTNQAVSGTAGIIFGIHSAEVTTALVSDTVTVNITDSEARLAASVLVVTPASGKTVDVNFVEYNTYLHALSWSKTSSSISSGDMLVAGLGVRSKKYDTLTGDSDTTNGNWSSLYAYGGTQNNAASVALQYKIATGAGTQTYSISSDSSPDSEGIIFFVNLRESVSLGPTVAADGGSYTVSANTGTNVSYGRIFATDSAAYSVTGTSATLVYAKAVYNDGGSYSVDGQTAGLIVGGAPTGFTFSVDPGIYSVSGQDVTYDRIYVVEAAIASYTITGAAANTYKGKTVIGDTGSYSVSGTDAGFLYGYAVAADTNSYLINGDNTSFLKGSSVVADTASYTVTGQDITMTSGQRRMNVDGGSYEIDGTNAGLFPEPPAGTVLTGPDPRITFWSDLDGLVISYPYGYNFAKYVRRSYNTNGNGNLFVSNAVGSGIFDTRGHLRITIVDGSFYTGIYAADGSVNAIVVDVDAVEPDQLFDPCGALRISEARVDTPGLINPNNGSLLVANIP